MITIENGYKAYEDQIIFDGLSLEIKDGEFVVFKGSSGCGKTTLLNMIGGIEPVNSGKITVNGFDITQKKNLRKYYSEIVGFLFQNFALIENKTVESNLNMIQKNYRTTTNVTQVLNQVGLSGKEKTKVYKLSGGEQQRVALARLIMKKCSVVLADEPTGSLDSENARAVIQILKDMNKDGKTIIMVTHDNSLLDNDMHIIELSKICNYIEPH